MNKELRMALGLPEDAKDEAVLAAVKASVEAIDASASLMTKLREVGGLDEKADGEKIVAIFKEKFTASLKDTGTTADTTDAEKSAMEQQIAVLNAKLVAVEQTHARERAEAFVMKAIANFQIVPSLKDHFIARHMKEPETVEKEVASMPALMSAGLRDYRQSEKSGDGLSPDERRVCQLMGVDAAKFVEIKTQNKELV